MAVYKCKYRIGFTDIYKNNEINNRAIIKILENAGGMHSDSIKCGYSDVERTGRGWVILAWKIKVLSRPKYNTEVETHTWVRDINKIFTYRDYEVYDENGNLAVIATSKWAMIDVNKGKIAEITPEIEQEYKPEDTSVFEERKIDKLAEPKTVILKKDCHVSRGDIDMNGHVHNINYLNYAYETLPDDVYENNTFNNIEIMYKRQIKLGDKIVCFYTKEDNKHIVTIKSEDEQTLHAIVELY